MKNSELILASLFLFLSSTMIYSQKREAEQKNNESIIRDTINFHKAKDSLYNGNWVFEATKMSLDNKIVDLGGAESNFIISKGDSCFLQLYGSIFSGASVIPSSQNGYGYEKCKSLNAKITEDRKGRIIKQITVIGKLLKADIYITLVGDGGHANVDVYQITTEKSVKLHYLGSIKPLNNSEYALVAAQLPSTGIPAPGI